MLNPFPIQFLALFAHFLLRATVSIALLFLGHTHFKNRTALAPYFTTRLLSRPHTGIILFASLELLVGLLLLLGLHTQYAAIALFVLSFSVLLKRPEPLMPPRLLYFLFLGCALSLFITGAGIFAFDLPL